METRSNDAAVFFSYSRRDASEFVGELHISLETCGFNCYFDKQDIASGEDWELRLRSLISSADTTVVIITEAWVASHECVKELEIALELGRRVIPVLKQQIDPAKLPSALSRLQFVFFCGEGHSYARGVSSLVKALREDLTWIRQQSRYLALAQDWKDSGKSESYVLRGAALEDGLAWYQKPTPERVHIPPLIKEFMNSSENAQTAQEKRRLRSRIRQLLMGGVTVTSLLCGGLGFMVFQAENQRLAAQVAEKEARQAKQDAEELQGQVFDNYVFNSEPEQQQRQQKQLDFDRSQYQIKVDPYVKKETRRFEIKPYKPDTEDVRNITPTPSPNVTPVPTPTPQPMPVPEPEPESDNLDLAKLVSDLNSRDVKTRIGAGQLVADLIRQDDNEAILKQLVKGLEIDETGDLTSDGRYNILYMLNLADSASLRKVIGTDLTNALTQMDDRASRVKSAWIGNQTRDCMSSLQDKLDGKAGKKTCGK